MGSKFTWIFLFFLLCFQSAEGAQNECRIFLNSNAFFSENLNDLTGLKLLESVEQAFVEFQHSDIPMVTNEEFRKLKAPSKVMTALKKIALHRSSVFEFILWLTLERKIFNDPAFEQPEMVKRIENIYGKFVDSFSKQQMATLYTTMVQGKTGMIDAKKIIALQLKRYEFLFSQIYGEPINLFEDSGWIKIFDLKDLSELNARIDENHQLNRELHMRIKDSLVFTISPTALYNNLVEEFFGVYKIPQFKNDAHGFLVRSVNKALIEELIVELKLGEKLEQKYFNDLKIMSMAETNRMHRKPFGYTLILFKAYLEVNEHIYGFTTVDIDDRYFAPPFFVWIKNNLLYKKMLRAIEDERYSRYIDRSDALNSKHKDLESFILDLKNRYPEYLAEIEKLEVALNKIQEINDFENDLDIIDQQLRQVEYQRDGLTEKILETISKNSLTEFKDLNFRWERLVADKTYNLKGVDYDHVVFSKQVVERFSLNKLEGTRLLAALSKSYVPIKKTSGLRRIPSIHDAFRDVKMIRSGPKIRLVGKLIGRTIYFFYVYEEHVPYDNRQMMSIIERYNP